MVQDYTGFIVIGLKYNVIIFAYSESESYYYMGLLTGWRKYQRMNLKQNVV